MWFFQQKTGQRLAERVKELDESLRDLQSRIRGLEVDREDLYDRLKRLVGRLSKRQAVDDQAQDPEAPITVAEARRKLAQGRLVR